MFRQPSKRQLNAITAGTLPVLGIAFLLHAMFILRTPASLDHFVIRQTGDISPADPTQLTARTLAGSEFPLVRNSNGDWEAPENKQDFGPKAVSAIVVQQIQTPHHGTFTLVRGKPTNPFSSTPLTITNSDGLISLSPSQNQTALPWNGRAINFKGITRLLRHVLTVWLYYLIPTLVLLPIAGLAILTGYRRRSTSCHQHQLLNTDPPGIQ
jgi:hypothetical protein